MIKALYDVSAPAKLNLFLHITGRRSDGFHLLQSVFMLIDWCDTLHFELRSDGKVTREDLGTALPSDDLILRAARALQVAAYPSNAVCLGAHIGVQKRIPSEAGMGGGSSDAASTLLALNHLWQLDFSLSKLIDIGVGLGADVPFFLYGRNAWVEGVGEKMTPITLPQAQFVVVKPPSGVQTATIFKHPDLKRHTPTAIISGFAENVYGFGRNDLQTVAQRICPDIQQALDWLDALGLEGRMTGSGSAVFALARRTEGADGTDRSSVVAPWMSWPAGNEGFQVKVCNNLQAHPQLGWARLDG